MVAAARWPFPILGRADLVVIGHALHFRGVFDAGAEGRDEIREYVVAGAVAAWAPDRGAAGILEATHATHHRIGVLHLESDVIE